jgi:antitoxin VapB
MCFSQACPPRIYILEAATGPVRVFRSGNSQTVRLPKEFRLKSKEVEIFRRGDEIVLREKDGTMARAFEWLAELPDDLEIEAETSRRLTSAKVFDILPALKERGFLLRLRMGLISLR